MRKVIESTLVSLDGVIGDPVAGVALAFVVLRVDGRIRLDYQFIEA